MNICVVAEDFPAVNHPYFQFVGNLMTEIAKQGHNVFVIAPQSITKMLLRGQKKLPYYTELTVNNNKIIVYRPQFVSAGNLSVGFLYWSYKKAVASSFRQIKDKIDVCYGHFWHSAYWLYPCASKYNIPLFVASGECEIDLHKFVSHKKLETFINYVSGVVCVSTKNLNESIEACLTSKDKCIVLPNAIDNSEFKVLDRVVAREELNLTAEDFVVAFVGGFVKRKGPGRISAAIDKLNDPQIKSIFVGYNAIEELEEPNCDGIVFKGPLQHNEIPRKLNAADVFVMPTLHEGCCNAIVEALACGLPVISSDRDFNYDVLDSTNSILINPLAIDQIADAIKMLKENKALRIRLREGALQRAKDLTIERRAEKILQFIKTRM